MLNATLRSAWMKRRQPFVNADAWTMLPVHIRGCEAGALHHQFHAFGGDRAKQLAQMRSERVLTDAYGKHEEDSVSDSDGEDMGITWKRSA